MSEGRHTLRMLAVTAVVLAVLGGLGSRLAFLHLGPNDELRAKVDRNRRVERKILVGRGRILDSHGNVMAMDLAVKNVCADPQAILQKGHIRFIGAHLARMLQLEPAMVFSRLSRPNRRHEYIKRFVPSDVAERIARMKLTGVFFEEASERNYPQGSLMCHVLGFSNEAGDGSAGVELRLDKYLRGSPGRLVSEWDGRKHEMYGRRKLEIPPQQGADIHLTLDQTIQYMVEKVLDQAMEEHHAKGVWAIVQRVRTGEILAMASRPAFDLNQYRTAPQDVTRNRATGYVYEPGSTFKVAVIAAALQEGVVHPDQVFDCENGMWFYEGRSLRDYHACGKLTVADVLRKSSNIGAAKIALLLGSEKLEAYVRDFGIGRRTGVDLPGEEAGLFSHRSQWTKLSVTRIAMGHEVAVTALQMLNLMSAIANGGFLMRPHVVARIMDTKGGTVYKAEPEVLGRPITEETAALMCRLLTRVTEAGGTGAKAALEGFKVAGKTGTAEKPVPGGYSSTDNMASFVGFLPADQPELAMIVVVDSPQPVHTGGAVAAPVFRQIAEEVVRYLNIVPPPVPGEELASSPARGDPGETS